MQIEIAADELERAVARGLSIVSGKSTMPILSSVLLEAKKAVLGGESKTDVLVVSAYDLEVGALGTYECKVIKEGAVCIDAKALHSIVKAAPEGEISLKVSSNRVAIESGSSEFKIVCQVAAEYPALPKMDKLPQSKMKSSDLLALFDSTQYAISDDETRYNLNGIYFDQSDKKKLRMVATDGHRLSLVAIGMTESIGAAKGVIVPKKAIKTIRRILAESPDADVQIGFSEGSMTMHRTGFTLIARLIDGQFPDYTQVIPPEENDKVKVLLPRQRLIETINRIKLLSAAGGSAIKMELGKNTIIITSANPDLGEAKDSIVMEYEGPPMKVGFNASYLLDVLEGMDTEKVALSLADELSPGVLRPVGGDKEYVGVVMPMRI